MTTYNAWTEKKIVWFMSASSATREIAIEYLESENWDVDEALISYFGDNE